MNAVKKLDYFKSDLSGQGYFAAASALFCARMFLEQHPSCDKFTLISQNKSKVDEVLLAAQQFLLAQKE